MSEKVELVLWCGFKWKMDKSELSEDFLDKLLEDFIEGGVMGDPKKFKITDLKGNILVREDV